MALLQQTIALIGVGVVIVGVVADLHADIQSDLRHLRTGVDKVSDLAAGVERIVAALEVKAGSVDQNLASLDRRIEGFDERLDGLAVRLASVEGTLTVLASGEDSGFPILMAEAPPPAEEEVARSPASVEPEIEFDVVASADFVEAVALEDESLPEPMAYIVVKEKDSSFGHFLRRDTLEIEIPGAEPTDEITIRTGVAPVSWTVMDLGERGVACSVRS